MQAPTFTGTLARSFSAPYASSLRNSQVAVARRQLASVTRKAITHCERPDWHPKRSVPMALVVSPNGRHGALTSERSAELLDPEGCVNRWYDGNLLAFDDHVSSGGAGITWDQKSLVDDPGPHRPGVVWRLEEGRSVAVYAVDSGPGDSPQLPAYSIESVKAGEAVYWRTSVQAARAVAAIGADLAVVAAFDTGKLRVYLPVPERSSPTVFAERDVGALPAWLSLIGSHIMLVFRDGGGSRLDALGADTKPAFSVKVPFEVLQPAIAGKGERLYLAGRGLVALDRDKVAWTLPSEAPVYASAFEDGSLAVAFGKRLDLVKPDGTVDQSFPVEESLVAPPAIAADGSVWVASESAYYIAR